MESVRKILDYCSLKAEEFLLEIGGEISIHYVSDFVLSKTGELLAQNNLSVIEYLSLQGIYAFIDEHGVIRYIGQGGSGSTSLKDRIGQELRLFKKTEKGNNAGTLSKNIQEIDNQSFNNQNEFKQYISQWKIKILHSDSFDVHIDLLESLLIELIKPRYNKKGNV